MKILNLEKISKIKRTQIINQYCGGHFGSREALAIGGVGIGGFHYMEGADIVDDVKKGPSLRANMESLKEGFGFYLRENEGNYLLLIKYSNILNISFYKEEDQLKNKNGFSLFKTCLQKGIPYHYAKLMLLDDEIHLLNKPRLKIITTDLDEINFICSRKNPLKIKRFFETMNLDDKFNHDYQTFAFL